ncbi:septal ring lytic transglycosylase RlpA family protein [Streptomyces mayteni]
MTRATDALWAGETTWFCCGASWGPCGAAGGGACGDCRADGDHAAWPHLSESCWELTRPDLCGEHDLPRRGCGSVLTVSHQCTGAAVTVTVSDCGPRTREFCGEGVCCEGDCRTNRVLDLTPAAFAALGSLDSGVLPVVITE